MYFTDPSHAHGFMRGLSGSSLLPKQILHCFVSLDKSASFCSGNTRSSRGSLAIIGILSALCSPLTSLTLNFTRPSLIVSPAEISHPGVPSVFIEEMTYHNPSSDSLATFNPYSSAFTDIRGWFF